MPAPFRTQLFYRRNSPPDTQLILSAQAIAGVALIFRGRIQDYINAGRTWDSPLGDQFSGERDITRLGIGIWFQPRTWSGPTTLRMADAFLQTLSAAATDTTVLPQGFVEESFYIMASTWLSDQTGYAANCAIGLSEDRTPPAGNATVISDTGRPSQK